MELNLVFLKKKEIYHQICVLLHGLLNRSVIFLNNFHHVGHFRISSWIKIKKKV